MPLLDPDRSVDPALRRVMQRSAIGLGLYAGALGVSFGAVSGSSGLSVAQTMVLSLVMFSGGSQFAFVGTAALGSAWAALPTALLLAVRNAFYGVRLAKPLGRLGRRRPFVAALVIDETTAMAVAQRDPAAQRYAFYATGAILFVLWQLGSLAGVLIGQGVDAKAFGLDVAAPAAFLALVWPGLTTWRASLVAAMSGLLAFVLIPVASAGVPVIATVVVAVIGGLATRSGRNPAGSEQGRP